MFNRWKCFGSIFALLLAGTSLRAQTTLRIAAAADLQPVLPTLIAPFEKSNGVKVEVSYASSATLTQQIINGAPFDLFLSADTGFPQKIIASGDAVESVPTVYAKGALVLWARTASAPSHLSTQWLTTATVQHIAVANPEHAPYGRAAIAALHGLGIYDSVRGKLVYAENVAQAAQYATSGNAQCALISQTMAQAPALRTRGTSIAIPASSYPPIEQGAVVIRRATSAAVAETFLQWILSPQGQQLLQAGGLSPAR